MTGTAFPVINDDAINKNINSDDFYKQYQYTIPASGVYIIAFTQKMTNGDNAHDLTLRIVHNSTVVQTVSSGGSTWVNYISPMVVAIVRAQEGDTILCQSSGGGTGSNTTAGGKVSIARIY